MARAFAAGSSRGARRALVVAVIATGCGGTNYVVRGSREAVRASEVAGSPDAVFGHTVRLTRAPRQYFGELIACDRTWVYLRPHERASALLRFAWRDGLSLDVGLDSNGPGMLVWSILGTVSSLSHGFWSILSVPVWGIAGGVATSVSWNPRLGLESCERARPFARFPQGIPAAYEARFDARAPAVTAPAPSLVAPWEAPPPPPSQP